MIHTVLNGCFPYYQNLSDEAKYNFQKRVQDFLKGRQFRLKQVQGFETSHKIVLAAHSVLLTLASEKYMFPYFNVLNLVSKPYEEEIKNRYREGKINMMGSLSFNLNEINSVLNGNEDISYSILHEFGHAIYTETADYNENYFEWDTDHISDLRLKYSNTIVDRVPYFQDTFIQSDQQFFASVIALLSVSNDFRNDFPVINQYFGKIFISLNSFHRDKPE